MFRMNFWPTTTNYSIDDLGWSAMQTNQINKIISEAFETRRQSTFRYFTGRLTVCHHYIRVNLKPTTNKSPAFKHCNRFHSLRKIPYNSTKLTPYKTDQCLWPIANKMRYTHTHTRYPAIRLADSLWCIKRRYKNKLFVSIISSVHFFRAQLGALKLVKLAPNILSNFGLHFVCYTLLKYLAALEACKRRVLRPVESRVCIFHMRQPKN